jgi:hypothetical protein
LAGFDKFGRASSGNKVVKMPPRIFRLNSDKNPQRIVICGSTEILSMEVGDLPYIRQEMLQFTELNEDGYVI